MQPTTCRVIGIVICTGLMRCVPEPVVPSLWGALEPGPFGVGLRVVAYTDSSAIGRPRPLDVTVWYPAVSDDTPALLFEDYVGLTAGAQQASLADSLREWVSTAVTGSPTGIARDTMPLILESPMRARWRAQPAAGRFPLVLWTVRHETQTAQSVLSEYLASHGYVVASVGYAERWTWLPWELSDANERMDVFRRLIDDLDYALERLLDEPAVDRSHVTILTWSYAAELAPQIQQRHDNVGLVIGLSSNPLATPGLYQGGGAGAHLNPADLTASYVVMTERIAPNGVERTAPPILEQLAGSYFVRFDDLTHGNFNVVEGMVTGVFPLAAVHPWSMGGPLAKLGYETIARLVLAAVEHSARAGPSLETVAAQLAGSLPDGFVTVTRYGS